MHLRLPALVPWLRPLAPALLVAAAIASCGTTLSPTCAPGEEHSVHDLLYFGTATPTGTVSPEAWSQFLADTVTPRFPDGLTAWPASGQWRSGSGALVQEGSYVLSLVHPEAASADQAIGELVAVYKTRFQQESVLRVKSYACMSL